MRILTPRMAPQAGEAGFTLVEVLVGLALSALVLAALNLAMAAVGRGTDRARAVLGEQAALSSAAEIFAGDVTRIAAVRRAQGYLFSGGPKAAVYVLTERRGLAAEALDLVRLSVRSEAGSDQLVRERAALGLGPAGGQAPSWGDAVVLLSGPYRISLAYRAPRAGERQWQDAWPGTGRMPEQMRLTITDRGTGRLRVPALVTALAADGEVECAAAADPVCGAGQGANPAAPP